MTVTHCALTVNYGTSTDRTIPIPYKPNQTTVPQEPVRLTEVYGRRKESR